MRGNATQENAGHHRLSAHEIALVRRSCSKEICSLLGITKHPMPETFLAKLARALKLHRDQHHQHRGHGRRRHRLVKTQAKGGCR